MGYTMEKSINMTEREAIEFTISKGYKGEEFETLAWKTGGCLKKDGTYKKLIKKLDCHFEKVEVTRKGKNKIYVLSNPKVTPTEMADNRKGRKMPRKAEDEILTNYVHRRLITLKEEDLQATTYNLLRKKIPLVFNQVETLASSVTKVFDDYLSVEKIRGVWSYTNWYLSDRAKKDIKLAIEHLAADKKIKVKTKWIASDSKSLSKVQIKQKEVNEINEAIRQLSIDCDIDYEQYQKSFAYPSIAQKMIDFQSTVESYLQQNFGYNYIYEALEIEVLDYTPKVVVKYEEAKVVFLQKVNNLVANKIKNDKYLKAQNKGEKFHYLCILLFLKANGIQIDGQVLKEEIECIQYRLLEIVKSFAKPRPEGFGRRNNP